MKHDTLQRNIDAGSDANDEVAEDQTLDEEKRKTRRGYATRDLPIVSADDERFWSVGDAAKLLGPPTWSEPQVRQLVQLLGLSPCGKRQSGARRRHVRVYDAATMVKAHSALSKLVQ